LRAGSASEPSLAGLWPPACKRDAPHGRGAPADRRSRLQLGAGERPASLHKGEAVPLERDVARAASKAEFVYVLLIRGVRRE
jgi:hypothetical protein